jgi:hypothetical protein
MAFWYIVAAAGIEAIGDRILAQEDPEPPLVSGLAFIADFRGRSACLIDTQLRAWQLSSEADLPIEAGGVRSEGLKGT